MNDRGFIGMASTDAPPAPAETVSEAEDRRGRHWRRRALRRLYRLVPKTMVGLVATSKILAMAPLLAMLVALGLGIERLLLQGEQLVAQGQRIEATGARLQDQFDDLERAARQYLVIEDPTLIAVFERRLSSLRETAAQLASEPSALQASPSARELVQRLDMMAAAWNGSIGEGDVGAIRELSRQGDRNLEAARHALYQSVQQLHAHSIRLRHLLTLSALVLIPLTVLLTWGLSKLITRPTEQLRAAIAALGTANYEDPVRITYPRELARLGDKLEWLRLRLRDLEANKDRFLRHVSHELKTPLASLREGTDLLLEKSFGSLNPRQAEVTQILAESAQDLDAQIRNLLAYAEWRNGQRLIEKGWIDCRILVEEVIASLRLPLRKRDLDTRLELLAPQIHGHRLSLRISLGNLLSNAIKHAPHGSCIEITMDRYEGRCLLAVRDRGRGVPEGDRERIVQPFVRGAEPEESGIRGTGIGLSIVLETVTAHGGLLEVQDAKPGARFVLDWPCPSPAAG